MRINGGGTHILFFEIIAVPGREIGSLGPEDERKTDVLSGLVPNGRTKPAVTCSPRRIAIRRRNVYEKVYSRLR